MSRVFSLVGICVLLICAGLVLAGKRDDDDWRRQKTRARESEYGRDYDESDYYHGRSDRVLFEKVTALTFKTGDYTTGRRSSPIKALQCIGGTANCKDLPAVVQCTRVGFDGSDAQWKCEADLSTDVKFGEVEVSCEGYAYPEDEYILKGSCGLKYKLDLTDAGKQRKKYDETHPYGRPVTSTSTFEYAEKGVMPLFGTNWGFGGFSLWSLVKWGFYASLFMSLFFGYSIFRWVLSLVFLPLTLPLRILSSLFGGSGAAQPSYHQGYQGYNPNGGGYGGLADVLGSYFTPKAYQPTTSGGGFWSGIFYGGLAGSLLGRWLGGSRQTQQAQQPVRVVKQKEDPRDKRPEPATTRIAAGYGTTTRR